MQDGRKKLVGSKNGLVTYRLDSGGNGKFVVDAITGRLKLREPLDYETQKSYQVTLFTLTNVGYNMPINYLRLWGTLNYYFFI